MSKQKERFKSSIDFLSLCLLFFIMGKSASIIFFFLWFITFPLKSNLKDGMTREFYLYLFIALYHFVSHLFDCMSGYNYNPQYL